MTSSWQPRGWWRLLLLTWTLVGVLVAAGLVVLSRQDSPRGLVRAIPLPAWLERLTQEDPLMYGVHAVAGSVFNFVGASPAAAASEWFKAAHHASSNADITLAAAGLAEAARRSSAEELEASLCPYVSEWSDTWSWGARGTQLAALTRADLSCGDASTVFGQVPADVPIVFAENPPALGFYHPQFHPRYGVASEPIPPSVWVHNLAHGEVVLAFKCGDACPDVVASVEQLQAALPSSPNSRGRGARLVATPYDDMGYPFAVLAWGKRLLLSQLDYDAVAEFYVANVDRGVECPRLYCPD
jgi:hypothetical protein